MFTWDVQIETDSFDMWTPGTNKLHNMTKRGYDEIAARHNRHNRCVVAR